MAGAAVPSIHLIVPTPDVSAGSADPDASTSVAISPAHAHRLATKGSVRGLFSGAAQTPYNTGQFDDIVRRVGPGSGSGSVTGRGWEVRLDGTDAGDGAADGMVLIRKKVKTRGRVDSVFSDVTNAAASASVSGPEKEGKDKWWNLTRGRKDTKEKEGGVLGFVRRGKSPALSPTLEFSQPAPGRAQRDAPMQTHLPGEPDCTLDMVDVPSVRGRGVMRAQRAGPSRLPRVPPPGPGSKQAPACVRLRVEPARSTSARLRRPTSPGVKAELVQLRIVRPAHVRSPLPATRPARPPSAGCTLSYCARRRRLRADASAPPSASRRSARGLRIPPPRSREAPACARALPGLPAERSRSLRRIRLGTSAVTPALDPEKTRLPDSRRRRRRRWSPRNAQHGALRGIRPSRSAGTCAARRVEPTEHTGRVTHTRVPKPAPNSAATPKHAT
ncbi:hypothetical protein B0H15DRAFT_963566 [Mycena belliarum]|uniref:Uncharacterized protein n=1 Tax=Mycena belliarum TaxID=1033014 RepID=A0AAD6TTA0_9AGAR|nr:hypothetical protein B0H15DRAFT_963566 [Mycena belliae]